MINIENRSLLTDALTPPAGYVFDTGLATTFSMDLVTLLTLPLHLAWLGTAESKTGVIDPLPVFEALRRTAERLTVFCHVGRMSIPRAASPLLALMEGMVHETTPKHGGAFHPKVWLLKFLSSQRSQPPRLRLLVLSRNLTDDRSWDLSLSLEGAIGRTKLATNAPLQKFLIHTQALSRQPISASRQKDLKELADGAHRCDWELPAGFDDVRFHALGIERKPHEWLPLPDAGRWDEFGVISPFVAGDALSRLAELSSTPLFLICRPDEMDKLAEGSERKFQTTQVMDARTEAGDQEDDVVGRLNGLHAKAFVGKRGWNTHLFVGSANATDAALLHGRNVEFMAELIGRTSKVLRPADWLGEGGLGPLLSPYVRSISSESEIEKQATLRLEAVRDELVAAQLHLSCTPAGDDWTLALHHNTGLAWDDVAVYAWPLSLSQDRAVSWTSAGALSVPPVPPASCANVLPLGVLAEQDLTTFTGFSLRLDEQELAFALNLPAQGFPEGRDLSILRAALRNREGFVRYLLMLLGNWEPRGAGDGEDAGTSSHWRGGNAGEVPLFEMLARAFSREPGRLAQVGEILAKLEVDPSGNDDIVPPEFRDMWKSFQQALREDATP